MPIRLPPLRERGDDVVRLAGHFVRRYASSYGKEPMPLSTALVAVLRRRPWPGNVRELENYIHRCLLMIEGVAIDPPSEVAGPEQGPDLPPEQSTRAPLARAKAELIAGFERQYLTTLLTTTGGNVSIAARLAGKERRAFGKLVKKYGLKSPRRTPCDAAG